MSGRQVVEYVIEEPPPEEPPGGRGGWLWRVLPLPSPPWSWSR